MMKKTLMISALACALLAGSAFTQVRSAPNNSRVTVVGTHSTVDGSSNVTEKLLEECIVSLPSLNQLEADVTARTEYMKEINGDAGKNDHVKYYSASVTVSYQVRQKVLIIITQNTIEGQTPVQREEERVIMMQSKPFVSDPGEGDMFAGRSNRRYFYSTAEKAAESAKARAGVWVRQQQNVLCAAGKK